MFTQRSSLTRRSLHRRRSPLIAFSLALVVAVSLLAGTVPSGTARAAGLLPADPQQALVQAFYALQPDVQQDVLYALRTHPTAVRGYLSYIESLGADMVQAYFEQMSVITDDLRQIGDPNAQYHFVCGWLGCTPQDSSFSYAIYENWLALGICGVGRADGVTVPGC